MHLQANELASENSVTETVASHKLTQSSIGVSSKLRKSLYEDVRFLEHPHHNLQVIVELANIELTPDNPDYEGGSWHIEGQLASGPVQNERIAVSAIYYYDSENIILSSLAFRHRGVDGWTNDLMTQDLGSVASEEGRAIAKFWRCSSLILICGLSRPPMFPRKGKTGAEQSLVKTKAKLQPSIQRRRIWPRQKPTGLS
ncbi:hypothetical protein N7462_000216 [Penicillium macrosclerotiorum]|uniref:uncharacterized protein n=1 Tax=Penicillium macrosclerotiorum TaxID=303699 RepID=UPI002548F6CB|nr:uncharacterized protein N7462_000216 [Penicillium macrosclerotiorum]KAJ5698211.1 hypothetical protein N7462_000216 [Penicillium macrosclerotiorum]